MFLLISLNSSIHSNTFGAEEEGFGKSKKKKHSQKIMQMLIPVVGVVVCLAGYLAYNERNQKKFKGKEAGRKEGLLRHQQQVKAKRLEKEKPKREEKSKGEEMWGDGSTSFVDLLKNLVIDSNSQEWRDDQCLFSLSAIKNTHIYKFSVDKKFANIDIVQGLHELVDLIKKKRNNSSEHQDEIAYAILISTVEDLLLNDGYRIGFHSGSKDFEEVHNKVRHLVYALKQYPESESANREAHLSVFLNNGVLDECQYAWGQALNQLFVPLSKYCDCTGCSAYRKKKPFLKSNFLANNLYNELLKATKTIKDRAFKTAVAINGNTLDKEQVHTLNFWADQFQEFGITYNQNDRYILNFSDKDKDKIKRDFLEICKKNMFSIVKEKMSYDSLNKDCDFQDTVSGWMRSFLGEKLKKDIRYKSMSQRERTQWVGDFYTSLIWDDNYKPREEFVYFLLYTFGFIAWDKNATNTSSTISTLKNLRASIFPEKFSI